MREFDIPKALQSPASRCLMVLAIGTSLFAVSARSERVIATFTNEGPEDGIFLVNPWIAFHDGSFDAFDAGDAASAEIESMAEDGNTAPLDESFQSAFPEGASATLAGPTPPGVSKTYQFDLDPTNPNHRYMSFTSMLIPSNDAFIGNDDPMTYQVFDEEGNLILRPINILGSATYDAGTEDNDEVPENVAFLAQMAPDTGVAENGSIMMHPGFMMSGSGGILDATREFGGETINFSEGDFTADGYMLARINVSLLGNPDTSSDFINISTRSQTGSGDNVQTAGFVVEGQDDKQVLIRAVGPTLNQFNVAGFLADPTLTVFDSDGVAIATNDDIGSQEGGASDLADISEATIAAGAFGISPDSLDAVLLLTLAPGSYTAQVSPKNGATGITLVEVYEVDF